MEDILRKEFGTKSVRALGKASGGCINNAEGYDLDEGRMKIFVKHNENQKAKVMFDGEYLGLVKISETKTLQVPGPLKVLPGPNSEGWIFIMEYIENMRSLDKHMEQLGRDLARLHLHNLSLEVPDSSVHKKDRPVYVDRFGFESTTCCGFIPMCNEWTANWPEFFARHRLKPQIDLVTRKFGDREAIEQWMLLERKLPSIFEGMEIKPSLLHGDLWAGNAAETEACPVVFDPAAFYGHSEFDLAITYMFGGFNQQFYDSYHSLIPKDSGFETRQNLYQLFHYLNHWNHFGSGYRHQSIQLMRKLV